MNIGCVNTFGHDRSQLRAYLFEPKKCAPIKYYLNQLAYYYKSPGFLQSLTSLFSRVKNKFRRSERRESTYLVLAHLFNHLDLSSWADRMGKAMVTFKKFTINGIAKALNMKYSRTQRAITDLTEAGYIWAEEHYEGWGKSSSAYVVKNKLFGELNIQLKDVQKSSNYANTSKRMKQRDRDYQKAANKLRPQAPPGLNTPSLQAFSQTGGQVNQETPKTSHEIAQEAKQRLRSLLGR